MLDRLTSAAATGRTARGVHMGSRTTGLSRADCRGLRTIIGDSSGENGSLPRNRARVPGRRRRHAGSNGFLRTLRDVLRREQIDEAVNRGHLPSAGALKARRTSVPSAQGGNGIPNSVASRSTGYVRQQLRGIASKQRDPAGSTTRCSAPPHGVTSDGRVQPPRHRSRSSCLQSGR
jgi:hypothetical protein